MPDAVASFLTCCFHAEMTGRISSHLVGEIAGAWHALAMIAS